MCSEATWGAIAVLDSIMGLLLAGVDGVSSKQASEHQTVTDVT